VISFRGIWGAALIALGLSASAAAEFPDAFFANYCYECHDDLTAEGEIRLDNAADRAWSSPDSLDFFERILNVLESGEMPPRDETHRPSAAETEAVTGYLKQQLLSHSKKGSTVLRRLNRREYENTIEDLFGFSFEVPAGFPPDQTAHGFDNVGEDLVLSPPLMESFFEAAVTVADELFPPPPKPLVSKTVKRGPEQMAISYSSSMVIDGSMRLAQRTPTVIRSCTWPTSFEAKESGRYRIAVTLSAIGEHEDDAMQFHVYAKNIAEDKGNEDNPLKLRRLAAWDVTENEPEAFECEVELFRGETPLFFYANAPLDSTDKKDFEAYLKKQFAENPTLLAGWMAVKHGRGLRGGVGWDRVKAKMAADDLDLSKAKVDSPEAKKLIALMAKDARQYVESISYQVFEEGPAVGVHETVIEGPFERVEDDQDRRRQKLRARFLGDADSLKGRQKVEAILGRFLPRAFRRPVSDSEVSGYTDFVTEHLGAGHSFEEGMHLAIRTALVSPDFLYRESQPGELDNYGLASRLSYFLTSRPPDDRLRQLSAAGKLTNSTVLEAETLRLLKDRRSAAFVTAFTGQWLGIDRLDEIMPDARLLDFKASDRNAMRAETERFFAEILAKNRPLEAFIDPDFTYLNQDLATRIYGRKDVKAKNLARVSLPKDSPHGGLLGQASVMMATANGVDTEPVLRGVWVLENILGDPPPPPPADVPAITPDTRGTKTIRDLMAAHTTEKSCAGCHRQIDPPGFVLENFDPIGRWRTHYPVYDEKNQRQDGPPVDAAAVMSDGTELGNVHDLKAHVVKHIDQFGACLAEKLRGIVERRSERDLMPDLGACAEFDFDIIKLCIIQVFGLVGIVVVDHAQVEFDAVI